MRAERTRAFLLLFPALWLAVGTALRGADLYENTAAAFDRYIRLTEARLDGEMYGATPFLWIDRLEEPQRREAGAWLRRGGVLVSRMETHDARQSIDIPGGLCHHWVGTVFAPGVTLDRTLTLMQGYDRYQEIYRPAVRHSHAFVRDGEHFHVFLQLFMSKVVSVVLNTEYEVSYARLSPTRVQVRSASTRIAEVRYPDTLDEQEKPIGRDNGFLWRFNNYCALEERDLGTYVQCESVSLTRSIPVGLGWFVGSFVTSIPRESLEFTLQTMRSALTAGR